MQLVRSQRVIQPLRRSFRLPLATVANAFVFTAKLLTDRAPNTRAAFTAMLPYRQQLIHVRSERLEEMGRYVLYHGAQDIVFDVE